MIVTKEYIHDLREKSFLAISEETEKCILEQLGKEPAPDENGHLYEYTEQDLWEQIRKVISNQQPIPAHPIRSHSAGAF